MVSCLSFQRFPNGPLQLWCVVGDEVGQVAILGIAPPRLDGIQLRCVSRQPFEFDMLQPRIQDLLGRRAMYTPATQDDDQRAATTLTQSSNEFHRFGRTNIVGMNLKGRADLSPLRRKRDRADDTQPVVPIPRLLHRRLATRSPRLAVHRLQAKARFIDKCNAGTTSAGFFLIRGQSCLRQRWTASVSCSRATRRGFCGLYPKSCRMRPRWSGWYETRNFLRTTLGDSRTRPQVGLEIRFEQDRLSRISSSSCFCSEDSFGAGPGCRLGGQRLHTTCAPSPSSNASRWKDSRRQVDSGFCERLPCLEILRSTTTSSFQLRRTALSSHKRSYGASSSFGSFTAQRSIEPWS